MDINKFVAQYTLKIAGGKPKITRLWDSQDKKYIDVYKSMDVPDEGLQTCATIGLNAVNIGFTLSDKPLRVELIGACDVRNSFYEQLFATISFAIMHFNRAYPGMMIPHAAELYLSDCAMKHVMLWHPFVWGDDIDTIEADGRYITWLMPVLISDAEYQYAQQHGVEALESLLEEADIDIYNFYRDSVL